jgi:hypothetical protein
MDELVEKFGEWSLRNEVHMNRQLNIIRRFAENTSNWVDTLYRRAENYDEAVEKKEKLRRLNKDMGNILEDVHDMFDTIADDHTELLKIFEELGKEFEKLPDDTP